MDTERVVKDFDELIQPGEKEFAASGLKAASLIRPGFLAVIPETGLLGKIGSLSLERRTRLLINLSRHLQADVKN